MKAANPELADRGAYKLAPKTNEMFEKYYKVCTKCLVLTMFVNMSTTQSVL